MTRSRHPTAISLFSGAGGMDIGFTQAGFDVRVCVELDPSCCQTLHANMPRHTAVLERDVRTISGAELLEAAKIERGQLHCLFGGPPCQSFSLAGARKGLDDDRGQLVGEFIRLVHEIQPKSFVMENVKGMATWHNGAVLKFIEDRLANPPSGPGHASYAVTHNVLNAASFGVAQVRHRIFIVGNRLEREFSWPQATHGQSRDDLRPLQSVGAVLGRLPPATPPSTNALRIADTIKGRRERHGY